nr:hypothetical protein [Rubripirellula sp.]
MMFWKRSKQPPLSARQRVDLELLIRRTAAIIGTDFIHQSTWIDDVGQLKLDHSSPETLLDSASTSVLGCLPKMSQTPTIKTTTLETLGQFSDYAPTAADGQPLIRVADELLTDSLRLVMELSYQHSMHFWTQVQQPHPLDTTPLTTHLLPLCCGLGLLASEACLYDSQWSLVGYSGWTLSRSGYYTAQEIGYSLAVLSQLKNQNEPKWIGRLRPDSRVTAQQTIRFFEAKRQRKSPNLFNAQEIPASTCDSNRLRRWLAGDDPDFALAAIEAMLLQNQTLTGIESTTLELTHSQDPSLVHAAIKLLGKLSHPSPETFGRLGRLINSRDLAIAIEAIQSLLSLDLPITRHQKRIGKIIEMLGAHGESLLIKIGQSKSELTGIAPSLCRQLDLAIRKIDVELPWFDSTLQCLIATNPHPKNAIELHCRNAVEILSHLATSPDN